jgi:hypothetical protein
MPLLVACLCGLAGGCLNLRPIPLEIPQESVAATDSPAACQPNDSHLSGALDGPTLRLALRDLAVILDTLGRLEQVRPELKSQMLREIADADAATVAAVVARWRNRIPEFPVPAKTAESTAAAAHVADNKPAHESAAAHAAARAHRLPSASANPADVAGSTPSAESGAVTSGASQQSASALSLTDWTSDVEPPVHPSWDDLLDSLVGMTRDRAEEMGPEATRARIQLTLLELVRRSQAAGQDTAVPDPQLWSHLDPAIQYCFGTGRASQTSAQEVVRSLQVATELLRGPGRFQVRALAFCTRIRGFGNIDRVDAPALTAGQAVLLYCEVEHFFSEPDTGGFRTRIGSVVELLDPKGAVVWSQDFGSVEDTSNGPRRDYFLSYRFRLPSQLEPGVYAIRIRLRDELANRSSSGAIALSIR